MPFKLLYVTVAFHFNCTMKNHNSWNTARWVLSGHAAGTTEVLSPHVRRTPNRNACAVLNSHLILAGGHFEVSLESTVWATKLKTDQEPRPSQNCITLQGQGSKVFGPIAPSPAIEPIAAMHWEIELRATRRHCNISATWNGAGRGTQGWTFGLLCRSKTSQLSWMLMSPMTKPWHTLRVQSIIHIISVIIWKLLTYMQTSKELLQINYHCNYG